jgi:hypothetical protein
MCAAKQGVRCAQVGNRLVFVIDASELLIIKINLCDVTIFIA